MKFIFLLCLFFTVVSLSAVDGVFAGVGIERNMNSREGHASGGGLYLGLDLDPRFGLGIKSVFSSTFNYLDIGVLETALLLRFYPQGRRFFLQTEIGYFLLFDDYTKIWSLRGLDFGWQFINNNIYLEPIIRFGYPFLYGVGLNIGFYLDRNEKLDEKSQKNNVNKDEAADQKNIIEIKTANVKDNWISTEFAFSVENIVDYFDDFFINFGIRYERMLGLKTSLGVCIYNHWGFVGNAQYSSYNYYEINTFFRFYPWGKTFFLGTGLGYYNYFKLFQVYPDLDNPTYMKYNGFIFIPEIGWKIDVGEVGRFYIMPCISTSFDISNKFSYVWKSRIFYFGIGYAF